MLNGATTNYAEAVQTHSAHEYGLAKDAVPAGLNIVLADDKLLFFADTTINFDPTAEQLARIAVQTAQVSEYFGQKARIAMLSYSNFSGSAGTPAKMKRAVGLRKILPP